MRLIGCAPNRDPSQDHIDWAQNVITCKQGRIKAQANYAMA